MLEAVEKYFGVGVEAPVVALRELAIEQQHVNDEIMDNYMDDTDYMEYEIEQQHEDEEWAKLLDQQNLDEYD